MVREFRGLPWREVFDLVLYSGDEERYAIGTEGCVNKFCSDMEEILSSNIRIYQGMTLVTPRVGEKIFSRFLNLVIQICERFNIIYIVVNDYGVLNALQKLNYKHFILGRTLIRSLAYTPWSLNLVKEETEEIKSNLFLPNIVHKSKLDLLKKYNIYAVELCYTPMLEPTIKWLQNEGVKIFYHLDNTIASIGRTCPYARLLNESASCCTHQCERMLNVSIRKIWNARTCLYEDVTETYKKIIPEYYNIENVLYYKTNNSMPPSMDFDTVIYQQQIRKNSITADV